MADSSFSTPTKAQEKVVVEAYIMINRQNMPLEVEDDGITEEVSTLGCLLTYLQKLIYHEFAQAMVLLTDFASSKSMNPAVERFRLSAKIILSVLYKAEKKMDVIINNAKCAAASEKIGCLKIKQLELQITMFLCNSQNGDLIQKWQALVNYQQVEDLFLHAQRIEKTIKKCYELIEAVEASDEDKGDGFAEMKD
ncbi:hypothetical protein CERSUDRAFT_72168 [Gelatoporia subvermispora B]|uniref:Uncharacterized protein n=1 Tax=Ceriporiopsis subvermispora (strain B) TaxID=914234 RepID=M2PQR8_CERS8|nr:hypothetical protein CERSUDRAFT_72168 [Gelatoporia subvermispora B]